MKKESSKERSNKESRKNIPPPLIPSPLAGPQAMGIRSEEEAMSSTRMESEEEEAMSSTGMRSEKQIDIAAFLRFFEAARREFHSTLPAVRWLSPGQRQSLQILYSKYGCEGVRETVIKFCRSSFINGRRGPTRRQFTLFWLFYEDNFLKTMGGAYDDPVLSPALQAAAERREARRQWMETNRRLYEEEKERERAQREQSVSRAITYEEWVEMNGGHKIEVPD